MASDSFLRLKGRTTYFRRKVPGDMLSRLASTEICFKLGVIDRDSAVQLGRRLAVAVDAFFVSARRDKMLSSPDLTALLGAALADWRASVQPVPIPLVSTRQQANTMASLADGLLRQQGDGYPVIDDAFITEKFGSAGIAVPSDPVTRRVASTVLTTGMAAHYLDTAAAIARQSGLDRGFRKLPAAQWEERAERLLAPYHHADGPDQVVTSRLAPPNQAQPAALATSVGRPPSLPGAMSTKFEREAGKSFSTQAPYLVGERVKAKQVGPDAVINLGASLRLWLQICGDLHIGSYSPQHMAEYRAMLVDTPKIYWRSKAEQEKTILQVIVEAAAAGPNYVRVSPKTVNKHLSNMNSVFEAAKVASIIDRNLPNFAEGLYLETGVEVSGLEEHEERPGYTRDQVELFFRHPVYAGRKSAYFYNDTGTVVIRDAMYWLPLLAAHELMRREEICQLKVRHVREEHGIWFFDLLHRDIKLKRASSRRKVPLHNAILELGFLDEVVAGRSPDELLFPELAPNAKGSFSDGVGKRVGRMVDALGIKLIRVDASEADGALHPFRHHGITQLENTHEVKSGIIDALTGHSSKDRKSERRRYTDEIYLSVLHDTINKLDIPVDLKLLNQCWRQNSLHQQKGAS